MTKKNQDASFEDQLEQLESIVETMESGELSLDEALKQFEQGVKLTKNCQQLLEKAKQRVQMLTAEEQLVDFDPDENDADS